jgi:hypothetical protein
MELIERHVTISNEALAVFVRFWLTSTPATALAAARPRGASTTRDSSKHSVEGWRVAVSLPTRRAWM